MEALVNAVLAGTSVLPPESTVSINRLYSVEDIAKVIGMSPSYVHNAISKQRPEVIGREGHRYLYNYTFLEGLLNSKGVKKDRVEDRKEHVESHQTILQRLHLLEAKIKLMEQRQLVVSKILGE